MRKHRIPATTLDVSALCYGAMGFNTRVTRDRLNEAFGLFRDAGGNFFDTAHCYCFWVENSDGMSERTLGELVRRHGCRDEVVIASKGGHPAGNGYPRPDAYISPEVIAGDLDDSLRRLGMDAIDLYYLHRDDARLPAGEILEMLNAEITRGRIRYPGASNWRVERIAEANTYAAAHGLQGFVASQPQWNLAQSNYTPGPDPDLRPLSAEDVHWHQQTGLPVIPYTSTAGGYFAHNPPQRGLGSFDNAVSGARHQRAWQLAAQLGCTANQVALAYLMHQDFLCVPIIGTTDPEHLADALAAPAVTLTAEQVRWLRDG